MYFADCIYIYYVEHIVDKYTQVIRSLVPNLGIITPKG